MDRHNLWVIMDKYKRKIFIKKELKRSILKSIKTNKNCSLSRRYLATYLLSKQPRFASRNFYNNRCTITGRVWSVNRRTGYGRFAFRSKIYNAELPGFRRAS